MKGIVFNLLEEAVTHQYGADGWCDLIDAAGVSGVYTSLGSYPDEELFALIEPASRLLDMPREDLLEWFGRAAMPKLAERYGVFFEGHESARSFVLSVNEIIHPEVRKLYAGAGCPHFQFDEDNAGKTLIGYRSPRGLCRLAHGFVLGAADHFGSCANVKHRRCMHDGDEACQMEVDWAA